MTIHASKGCFNSIKVRLKLNNCKSQFLGMPFQFHKGTIKTACLKQAANGLCSFNSIKVRLKRIAILIFRLNRLFQFHKGTIKTTL